MVNLPLICPKKRQKEEFIFFSGLNTISAQMLGTCNSAPISPMGCWSLSLSGEQAHCQSRRADGNAVLGTLVIRKLFTCHAISTWLGNVQDDLGNTGQDFTLFSFVILHPDSSQLWPSQTPLKSEVAAFSKAACSKFRGARSLCPLPFAWLHLGPSLFLQRFSSAHLELCSTSPGKEYIYSKCKDKYLLELICNSTTGKLFKNNNNNKKTS